VIAPLEESIEACRLFARQRGVELLSVENLVRTVPKVMLVAVPPPGRGDGQRLGAQRWRDDGGGAGRETERGERVAGAAKDQVLGSAGAQDELPVLTEEAAEVPVMLSIAAKTSLTFSVLPVADADG